MRLDKKYRPPLIAAAMLAVFLATRLYHILAVPIFTDESIYIRWTEIFRGDVHQLFVSLDDGKQPLFVWIGSIFLRFVHDPLLAVRLVSVGSGLFTMIGLYLLTNELFRNKKLAVTAACLYIIYPFALVYDKLALYDGMLATFAVWSLYAEVLLVRLRKLSVAVIAALIIGGALLTKSSAFFYLYLLPFSLLLFDFKGKTRKKDFVKWLCLGLVVVAGSVACYSILKFSPNFKYIASKNNVFIYPFTEWIKHPFRYFGTNLRFLWDALVTYSTIPLLVLAALAPLINRKFLKQKLLLVAWFIVPFAALVFFGKLLYPRYIFFMAMPLLILAADSLLFLTGKLKPTYLKALVFIILLLPMAAKDYVLLTNFGKAAIPPLDHSQLIGSFESGVGVNQTVTFLTEKSKSGDVYVGTEGTFGVMPDALQDYFNGNKNIQVTGFWPITDAPPPELLAAAKTMPTYFVFYAPCPLCSRTGVAPIGWPVKPVLRVTRLDGSLYTVYQVILPE